MHSSSVATWTRGGLPWSIATWTLRETEEKRLEHTGKVFYIDSLPVCAEHSDSDTESDQYSDIGDSHCAFLVEKGAVFEPGSESSSASTPGIIRADSKICLLAAEDLAQLAQASKRSLRISARVAFFAGRVVHYPIAWGWLQLSQASNMALKAAAVMAREYMKSWKATDFLRTQ